MATLLDIKTNDIPNMVEKFVVQKDVHRPHKKVPKSIGKLRKMTSERLQLKWFQKPIIGLGSNSNHHMGLTKNDAGTLT